MPDGHATLETPLQARCTPSKCDETIYNIMSSRTVVVTRNEGGSRPRTLVLRMPSNVNSPEAVRSALHEQGIDLSERDARALVHARKLAAMREADGDGGGRPRGLTASDLALAAAAPAGDGPLDPTDGGLADGTAPAAAAATTVNTEFDGTLPGQDGFADDAAAAAFARVPGEADDADGEAAGEGEGMPVVVEGIPLDGTEPLLALDGGPDSGEDAPPLTRRQRAARWLRRRGPGILAGTAAVLGFVAVAAFAVVFPFGAIIIVASLGIAILVTGGAAAVTENRRR